MAYREDGNLAVFVENFCEIHGRFGNKVYRRKNNGQPWIYDYVYKPKYAPTTLSRRSVCVVKAASGISNPQYKGYKAIINKLYYYTPYFVYAGVYNLCCETFLKIRQAGQFTVMINGMRLPIRLFKRKMLTFEFVAGEYEIKCYNGDVLYSERKVIVMDAEAELEEVYSAWYTEHLGEILHFPDPRFRALRIYHRGVEMPFWVQYIVGKTESGIMYRSKCRERFVYSRKAYEHQHNANGDYFYTVQKRVMACWSAASGNFRRVWEKYHIRWFDANYRKDWKKVKQHNLWSRLVFRAGGVLGFDLEEISPDNWLWGVETLGDLLKLCGMRRYGLSGEELAVEIF
ncbi:MAG: hypothetical protein K9M99_03905 [Candidatus Cloacimonetes bacterium]|nr:hypothetical protein [Candidatus Cloacimonadota bacterium]